MGDKEELGARIKQSVDEWKAGREERTLDALAAECGWVRGGKQRVSNYAAGLRTPKPWEIHDLARVLGKSPTWLAFGTPDSPTKITEDEMRLLEAWRKADAQSKELALHALSFRGPPGGTEPPADEHDEPALDKALPKQEAMKLAGLDAGDLDHARAFDAHIEREQALRRRGPDMRTVKAPSRDPRQRDLLDPE